MTRLAFLGALCLLFGCSVPLGPPLPVLSLHAIATLRRQRDARLEHKRSEDFTLSMQLSFGGRGRPRASGLSAAPGADGTLPLTAAYGSTVCDQPALCEWAWSAELATLMALGVAP